MSTKYHPQCSRCRVHKEIVARVAGMNYCQDCEKHMPTQEQFDEYLNANLGNFIDLKKKKKFSARINIS